MKRWLRVTLSIVLGNLLYFYSRPWLPSPYVHERFRLDPGLALDFLVCLALYGAARRIWP